jgi:hypothetical protein
MNLEQRSSSKVLFLAAMHDRAPGVLGRVFGPDGDFLNAPRWTGPVASAQNPAVCGPLALHTDATCRLLQATGPLAEDAAVHVWTEAGCLSSIPAENACLNPLVSTVGGRLARLCAHALGGTGDGWWLRPGKCGGLEPGWSLYARTSGPILEWTQTGRLWGSRGWLPADPATGQPLSWWSTADGPQQPLPQGADFAAVLVALTLTLAPWIMASMKENTP